MRYYKFTFYLLTYLLLHHRASDRESSTSVWTKSLKPTDDQRQNADNVLNMTQVKRNKVGYTVGLRRKYTQQ